MNRILLTMLVLALTACSQKPDTVSAPPSQTSENAAGAASNALATPEAIRAAHVEVQAAGPAAIRRTLTLYGAIKGNAEREQEVRARYPGVVRSVAKRPGDHAVRGETLLTVESNDSLEPYAIRSPIGGTVLERWVNPGETVDGSTTLMTVADLSSVWAEFSVFPQDRSRLKVGQSVAIGDTHGMQGDGQIDYVAAAGTAASQTITARSVLNNTDGRWTPGQFVTGNVVVDEAEVAVAVAPAALQQIEGQPVVFAQTENGFVPRAVEIGRRGVDAVEIIEGLAAGERYVFKNSYLVKAEVLKSEAAED